MNGVIVKFCCFEALFHRLLDVLGSILAQDINAKEPYPPFAASVKDGYAVLGTELYRPNRVTFIKSIWKILNRCDAIPNPVFNVYCSLRWHWNSQSPGSSDGW